MTMEKMMEYASKIPPEAWAGLAGVIIGSILSVFGVWLSNRANISQLQIQLQHEKESRRENTQRQRLEELYVIVGAWLNNIAINYMSLAMVMQGKLSYNDHLDMVIKNQGELRYDFNRLEMLIDIYAIDLKSEYEAVIEARGKLNEVAKQHKWAYEEGNTDGEVFLKSYINAQVKIENLGKVLSNSIARKASNREEAK